MDTPLKKWPFQFKHKIKVKALDSKKNKMLSNTGMSTKFQLTNLPSVIEIITDLATAGDVARGGTSGGPAHDVEALQERRSRRRSSSCNSESWQHEGGDHDRNQPKEGREIMQWMIRRWHGWGNWDVHCKGRDTTGTIPAPAAILKSAMIFKKKKTLFTPGQ